MNKKSPFKVQPIKRYRQARYGSESAQSLTARALWLSWFFPQKVARAAVTLLLAAGLALGSPSCSDSDTIIIGQGDQDAVETDSDNALAGVPVGDVDYEIDGDSSCGADQLLACSENFEATLCRDGEIVTVNCNDYCAEHRPPDEEIFSIQCSSDDPSGCECEYDMLLGVMVECTPGEVYCLDNETVQVCDDTSMFQYKTCEEYCESQFGEEYQPSSICDEDQSGNLCDCQLPDGDIDGDVDGDGEDIPDGDLAYCTSGEMYCEDGSKLFVCENPSEWFTMYLCEDYCVEEFGADYVSYGCDAEDTQNPCQCEYGIIEGEPIECFVGEDQCADDYNLNRCTPYDDSDPADHQGEPGYYQSMSCNDWCYENYGYDYYSLGCYEGGTELCNCEYGAMDGVMPECFPGEMYCEENGMLSVCEGEDYYYGYWTMQSCDDICTAVDPSYTSGGCDVNESDDPCLCGEQEEEEP